MHSPFVFPLRNFHWWVGPAFRPGVCLQPMLGAQLVWCVVIFPCLSDLSHFGGLIAPVGADFSLLGLWHCFG